MPHYEIKELEKWNAYVTTVERRKALFNAFEDYKKAYSKGKIIENLPPLLLDEEVYLALCDEYNEKARDRAADFIIREINEILAKLKKEQKQKQEKEKGQKKEKAPAKAAVKKDEKTLKDGKHLAENAARRDSKSISKDKDKSNKALNLRNAPAPKNRDEEELDIKSDFDTNEAIDNESEAWGDDVGEAATWDEDSNNDESVQAMHLSYDAHVKAISSRLKALAIEAPLEYSGAPMDQKTYVQNTVYIYENIPHDYPPDIFSVMDPGSNTLRVSIPSQNDTSEDVIIRSYDSVKKQPKLSITNPPDDHSIVILLDMNKDMMPLTMTSPCHNENTAIRIFEASVISGRPVNLHPEDVAMLRHSKEKGYADRFQYLESLLQANGKEQLKAFKELATESEDWKFGLSDIPPKFYKDAPMHIAEVQGSELDFEPTKPKGKR